jgi:hypothetical protein
MSRIDRISRALPTRRTVRFEADRSESAAGVGSANLPVPVGPALRVTPPPSVALGGESGFEAHVIGQDGQRRGLRAGPGYIEDASRAYNRVEYSGRWDRRARVGRTARAEI